MNHEDIHVTEGEDICMVCGKTIVRPEQVRLGSVTFQCEGPVICQACIPLYLFTRRHLCRPPHRLPSWRPKP